MRKILDDYTVNPAASQDQITRKPLTEKQVKIIGGCAGNGFAMTPVEVIRK